MNEILVARKAFAETLTSSAVARSVQMYGVPASSRGAYTWRRVASAVADVTPATSRSGRRVSCTAKPSRRNSGFHASSASGPFGASSASRPASRAAVPTGTVDLPAIRQLLVRYGASPSITGSMALVSAAGAGAARQVRRDPVDHGLDGAGVGGQRAGQLGSPHADEIPLAQPSRIS